VRGIVERLRESAAEWIHEVDTRKEAAAEIERLRARLAHMAVRTLNVASCLEHGMSPDECAAELRLIVERVADSAPGGEHETR
jgi:hypothetical protein